MTLRQLAICSLALFAAACGSTQQPSAPQELPHPLTAAVAPALKDWQGHSVKDASLTQRRFVVLWASASWSRSCHKFSPQLVEAYNRLCDDPKIAKDVLFILLSYEDSPAATMAFMSQYNVSFPCLLPGSPERDLAAKQLLTGMPALTLLDEQGKVVLQGHEEIMPQIVRHLQNPPPRVHLP